MSDDIPSRGGDAVDLPRRSLLTAGLAAAGGAAVSAGAQAASRSPTAPAADGLYAQGRATEGPVRRRGVRAGGQPCALARLRHAGGGYDSTDRARLAPNGMTILRKTLIACQNGGMQSRRDLPGYLSPVENGQFDVQSLISKVYPFDDVIQAFQDVADRTVIGAVVKF